MNLEDTKRKAKDLYKKEEYLAAYSKAFQMPFNEFIKWFTNQNNKRRNRKDRFFYDSFFYSGFIVTTPPHWLKNHDSILLWEYYLESQNKIIIDFELYVAHNNPELFMEGYRSQRLFLDQQRLRKIEKEDLPLRITSELIIWHKLIDTIDEKWNAVLEEISNLNLLECDLLPGACAACEQFIFQNTKDKVRWQFAGEALSLLIAYLQSIHDFDKIDIDNERLYKSFLTNIENDTCRNLFDLTYDFIVLKHNIYDYAFDHNTKVKMLNDNIQYLKYETSLRQWNYDELRYNVNEYLYSDYANNIYNILIKADANKFANNNKSKSNIHGNTLRIMTEKVVEDLGIDDSCLDKYNLPNLHNMISFLHGIAYRKYETSLKPLHKLSCSDIYNYKQAIAFLFIKTGLTENILLTNKKELHAQATSSGNMIPEIQFESLIHNFTYNWKVKKFNALKVRLSLWQKPFIKVGNNIISPLSILARFSNLYTITESVLRNFKPKNGTKIENILTECFKDQVWQTSTCPNKQEHGDVDVVMEDESHIVYMQLKRTSQKLNIEELHLQKKQDNKAIKQLNEAAIAYRGIKKLHLWYVTTAFEKVGTFECNVRRVSYQDLLHIKRLLDSEFKRFESLNDFIEMVETDRLYKHFKENCT